MAKSEAWLRSHWDMEAAWSTPAYWSPDYDTGPAFGAALLLARHAGRTSKAQELLQPVQALIRGFMTGKVCLGACLGMRQSRVCSDDSCSVRQGPCRMPTHPRCTWHPRPACRTAWQRSLSSRLAASGGLALPLCPAQRPTQCWRCSQREMALMWGVVCVATYVALPTAR